VIVKICGLTNAQDARAAIAAGADMIGFVFAEGSRRRVEADACGWISGLRGALRVGVFRDAEAAWIDSVAASAGLDLVQLHGREAPDLCVTLGGRARVIKAISVGSTIEWDRVALYDNVARILFDTASAAGGGSGATFDWGLLKGRALAQDCLLAGGLTAENVAGAIAMAQPGGVDVASGVEVSPGRKDHDTLWRFVAAARNAGDRVGCTGRRESAAR